MKKIFFLILVVFTLHSSVVFADSNNMIKIIDSSQVNTLLVNKLTSVVDSGAIPLLTIIPWAYEFDPSDNNCVSSKTGGDGKGGQCRWLECNGQPVNPNVYKEYGEKSNYDYTPNVGLRPIIPPSEGFGGGSWTPYSGLWGPVEGIWAGWTNSGYQAIHSINLELDYAWEDTADGKIDGLTGFEVYEGYKTSGSVVIGWKGDKGVFRPRLESGYQNISVGSGTKHLRAIYSRDKAAQQLKKIRYLVRVSN